jgi:RNA polymerase sigma factor (sigma-70 family)
MPDAPRRRPDSFRSRYGESERLTREEEQALARRVVAGDASAADELTRRNLPLVISIAARFSENGAMRGMDIDELVQEGNIALMNAAKLYRPGGTRFSTYATYAIRREVIRAICRGGLIHVPHWLQVMRLRPVSGLGKVAARRAECVACAARAMGVRGLGEHARGTNGDGVGDSDPAAYSPLSSLAWPDRDDDADEWAAVRGLLPSLIAMLGEREALVIRGRFGIGGPRRTQPDIGRELGVTKERVRQIEVRAIEAMRMLAREMARGQDAG